MVVVLDGGQSTQLEKYVGHGKVDDHPLWTSRFLVEAPDYVLKMHEDFLKAGSDIVSTLTYQASVDGFNKYLGLNENESKHIFQQAFELADKARSEFLKQGAQGRSPLIAGSVGPYGATLHDGSEYTGDYMKLVDKPFLKKWHRLRVAALVQAGVDLLAFETIPSQMEGEALAELLKEFPDTKAWLSFSCKDDLQTAHGELFSEAVAACWRVNPEQLVAVGCNCVNPNHVSSLLRSAQQSPEHPFVVYPNSGEVYQAGKGWTGVSSGFTAFVQEWVHLGASYIGGCCRTTSEDIATIRAIIDQLSTRP